MSEIKQKCFADMYADPPQDCDAPYCGCNPAWHECIQMLQEIGWMSPDEIKEEKKKELAIFPELLKFYQAENIVQLVSWQAAHVEKLQASLEAYERRNDRAFTSPREG